ncbi:MAG: hypothetical protein LUE31_09005 [Lachnospiraceae bacterium]|nr:hypothetical protein [Lachnospiraceae bacterium]
MGTSVSGYTYASKAFDEWSSSDGSTDKVLTVSTTDLKTPDNYTSYFGWSGGNGGYDTSTASSGFMPKLKVESKSTLLESQYTWTGAIASSELNIAIPDDGSSASLTSLQATLQTASIHAGSVETLTIEFTESEGNSYSASAVSTTLALLFGGVNAAEEMVSGEPSDIIVTVYDESGAVVATTTLANTVLTIPYDYNSELELTLDNGLETASYIIQPSDYQRKVLVWDDGYYLICSDGLTNQDGEVLTASGWSDAEDADALTILNLADGQALTDDGEIYDLESGTCTRNISETVAEAAASSGTADDYTVVETVADTEDVESEGFLTENQAIYSFSTDAGQVESYRNFSYIISDSGVTRQETMLPFKDGSSVGFDPDVELDPFGILYDTYLGETYLAVLSEGELVTYSFGDTLTWPEEVSTSGIAQMSNTLNTDQTILIILYTDGSAIVFDYLSGEILNTFDSETEESGGGFISYLISAFSHWASSLMSGQVITTAESSASLIDQLSENPYSAEALELVNGLSAETGTAEAYLGGSEETDGTAEADPEGTADERGTEEASEEASKTTGDEASGDAEEAGTTGDSSKDTADMVGGNVAGASGEDGQEAAAGGTGDTDVSQADGIEASAGSAASKTGISGIEEASGTDEESEEGSAAEDSESGSGISGEADEEGTASAEGDSSGAGEAAGTTGSAKSEAEDASEVTKMSDYTVIISADSDEYEVYETGALMGTSTSDLMSENEKVNYLAAAGLYDLYSSAEITLTDQTENGIYTLAALLAAITALLGGLYFVRRRKGGEQS